LPASPAPELAFCYCSQRKPGAAKHSLDQHYDGRGNGSQCYTSLSRLIVPQIVISYCTQCGAATAYVIPPLDSLPRAVCSRCGHIHYENPRMVVGCVAEWQGSILLCRRAIQPRHGLWTLPAGFMEMNETTAEAAARETLEEACATVEIDAAYAMVNLPHVGQVHLFYRGRLPDGRFAPGEESLETALFAPADIPWESLAFRSVAFCLQHYLRDRETGSFGFHCTDYAPR